jgi:hypothetical protein
MQTPSGPLTAIGDTADDARIALERLVALTRALDPARKDPP